MDKTQLLERHFSGFINLENGRDFFIGMTDYLDLANSFPELEHVDEKITSERIPIEGRLLALRKTALEKVMPIYEEISNYVEHHKIEDAIILQDLKEAKGWAEGWIRGSQSKPLGLHTSLGDVIDSLYKLPEHKEFALKYLELYKNRPDLINRHIPIDEVQELETLESEFSSKADTELWGQLGNISVLYRAIKYSQEKHKLTSDEARKIGEEFVRTHGFILSEWSSVERSFPISQEKTYFFKVNKVKPWLLRLHNYLLKELTLGVKPSIKGVNKVYFDPEKSRLVINQALVAIRKFSEQYHCLRIIFENKDDLNREWFFSELSDLLDRAKGYTDKDFHNYFSAIKRRVSAETGVKDLFITTTQSVRINPDYLKSE